MELQTFTLSELLEKGDGFLFPGDGTPDLIPRRMWNLVQANPDHRPDLPVAACLLADGKRAASITLPNQTIHFRGEAYPCLWGHLWAVLEGNPLPGAGALFLHQLVRRLNQQGVGFGATGPTRTAVAVMERIGYKRVAFCPRYVLAVGSDAVSRKVSGNPVLGKAASLPVGVGLAAWTTWARRRLARQASAFQRRDLASWNEDLRVLDKDPRAGYIHVGRSPEFVAWKENFLRWSAPDATPLAFSLLRGNEPAGYVNMRCGEHKNLGSMGFENARLLRVMDCMTDGPEATAAAVYHVLGIARETRSDFVEFVGNDPWLVQVARHAKLKESHGMSVYLRGPEGWPPEFEDDPTLWNIGLMESDGAFAEAPAGDGTQV